ncbi:hypothetical protein ALI22I_13790 [Saccharothrix sp. ALI-22-I]|uniref:hypothetical protein n=1 Tax=Saccharothrix sp. ALI-22-I TaxID=1933778 RepID=UPI00097BC720|nr:hypothetical protein [Saccharothrix sp. ALI-22-I]ONI89986.1 hypothetical protein ALI22I_13790 [Saccharothrix sp. ALI-22-I]
MGDIARAPAGALDPSSWNPARALDETTRIRTAGPGGSIAVVREDRAYWVRARSSSCSGGDGTFSGVDDYILERPRDNVLDLLVTWPLAGLADARARIPLD